MPICSLFLSFEWNQFFVRCGYCKCVLFLRNLSKAIQEDPSRDGCKMKDEDTLDYRDKPIEQDDQMGSKVKEYADPQNLQFLFQEVQVPKWQDPWNTFA